MKMKFYTYDCIVYDEERTKITATKNFALHFHFAKHIIIRLLLLLQHICSILMVWRCYNVLQLRRQYEIIYIRMTNCPKRKFRHCKCELDYGYVAWLFLLLLLLVCACALSCCWSAAAAANWPSMCGDFARLRVIRFSGFRAHTHTIIISIDSMKINEWLWWWSEWWRPFKNNKCAKSSICSAFESIYSFG